MSNTSDQKNHHISTNDLAFSAYLKLKGFHLIKSNGTHSKRMFVFNIGSEEANTLKMEFINSEFLKYYNELRNIKKLL
jgi:hypothetical protein